MMRYQKIRNAALLLGVGLGGFLDGIVFRQISQWHQRSAAADRWLEGAAWLVVFAGVLALWRGIRGPGRLPSTRTMLAYMVVGWGLFNLTYAAFYNWAFVIAGGGLVLLGLALRDANDRVPASAAERRAGRDRRLTV
jgi:hypothetical protein